MSAHYLAVSNTHFADHTRKPKSKKTNPDVRACFESSQLTEVDAFQLCAQLNATQKGNPWRVEALMMTGRELTTEHGKDVVISKYLKIVVPPVCPEEGD